MGKKNKNKGRIVFPSTNRISVYGSEELSEAIDNEPTKLRFSPVAWSKLLFMRDIGDTEVGGFGIALPNDLLYINDFILPKQKCGYASVDFDDKSVADFVENMVDMGMKPEQFLRIWIHTHPNMSAKPSITDETTFARVFGKCDWSVMAIISSNENKYCRLRINSGPFPCLFEIPIEIDYKSHDFAASDFGVWADEYKEKVDKVEHFSTMFTGCKDVNWGSEYSYPYSNNFSSLPHQITIGGDDDDIDDSDDEVSGWELSDFDIPDEIPMSIPDELLQRLTPNQLSLLENMSPNEREYVISDLKERLKIGD